MIWKQFALTALLAMASALALSACANSEGSSASSSRLEALPASCPSKTLKEGAEAATNRNTRSNASLVPSQPNELLLCRYYGFGINQTPKTQARAGKLGAERWLHRPGVVRSISREFNDLPQLPRHGAISCPSDEGAMLYAIFHYAGEPPVPVEIHLSGCRFASNGRARAVAMTPRLLNRLARLNPLGS
jgi:hypothetical protein